ncbi:MAG: membrane dipeptidase [Thermodesulfobacteriota bacterium]
MKRRDFIKAGVTGGLAWGLSPDLLSAAGERSPAFRKPIEGMSLWDAHAHPHSFFSGQPDPTTPTIAMMKSMGMKVCVFAAVGDRTYPSRSRFEQGTPLFDTARQLDQVLRWAREGEIRLIRTKADLDQLKKGDLGAIVGIEGGDALEGHLKNLDYFFDAYAVRIITLMHDRTNEIGGHQRALNNDQGLTSFGRQLVRRMNQLGMLIDLAHAGGNTLKDVCALSSKPVLDSHTSPATGEEPSGRLRSWPEMKGIAERGGLICTWPFAFPGRETLKDWASEISTLKTRLGLAHVALGTDGGGRLPKTIEGYRNILDLPKLIEALEEAGFTRKEIQAFMGGNLERVVRENME